MYTIVNAYTPNNHQIQFFNRQLKKVKRHQKGILVICGDLNLTPDPSLDSTSQSKRTNLALLPSIVQHDLHDAWRCLHVTERDFTFFSPPHRIYTRIDLFLVDQQTLLHTLSVTINPITWSDHASMVFSISDSTSSNARPIWRINTFILQQRECKKFLKVQLLEFFSNNAGSVTDPFTLWNAHKAFMRGICIQVGVREKGAKAATRADN